MEGRRIARVKIESVKQPTSIETAI